MASEHLSEQPQAWTTWALVGSVAAVAVLFALSFGAHGYAPTDQGFVLGQSWRIQGGQVPYRDFFYIRTPGSLYLHTVWFALPDAWIFRAGRFAYYAQLAVAALLPALFALRAGWVTSPPRLILLCVAFYVAGIHNFPPMPWYTVDGIFFATLALVAVLASRTSTTLVRRLVWLSLASLLLGLAGLVKQNYGGLVALLVVSEGVFLVRALRRGHEGAREEWLRVLAAGLPAVVACGFFALWLWSVDAWVPFIQQVTGGSSPGDLWKAGVVVWLQWPIAAALIVGGVLGRLGREARWGWLCSLCVAMWLGWIAWDLPAWLAWGADVAAGQLLFAGLLGALLSRAWQFLRAGSRGGGAALSTLSLGTLAIAWSASLSFGVNSPLLGLVSAGAMVEIFLARSTRFVPVQLAGFFLVAAALTFQVWQLNAQHPYLTVPREQQTRAYHEIFPRFGKLYGGEELGDRFQELRRVVEQHAPEPDRDFTVIPSFPLVHFLLDRQTRAPMDWYVLFDLMGGLQGAVVARLRDFDGVAFLERNPSDEPCSPAEFANAYRGVSLQVLRHGRLLESTRRFCVVDTTPSGPPR